MGRSITTMRSVAIDPNFTPLGAPVWIEKDGRGPIRSLMVAQDTGGAIKGMQRADIFYGTGAGAGEAAGTVKDGGRMVLLAAHRPRLRHAGRRLTDGPPSPPVARGGRPLAHRRPHRARRCIRRSPARPRPTRRPTPAPPAPRQSHACRSFRLGEKARVPERRDLAPGLSESLGHGRLADGRQDPRQDDPRQACSPRRGSTCTA